MSSGQRGTRATSAPPLRRRPVKPTVSRWRWLSISLVFALVAGILGYRVIDLQVLDSDRYVALGASQRHHVRLVEAPRGNIVDRNGEQLATSVPRQTVWADPRVIDDPEAVTRALFPYLNTAPDVILERLSTPGAAFVYLERQVDQEVADVIEGLDLPGVGLLEEPGRQYPAGDVASGVIGFVGDDNYGLAGLEYQYDDLLTGTAGEEVYERDPAGRIIPSGGYELMPAQAGQDLILTIDRSIQFEVERQLTAAVRDFGARRATAVVTRPSDGHVLAMATVVRDEETGEIHTSANNLALTWTYEPGSVMKPVTFAAVIEEGLANPDTRIDVPYSVERWEEEFTDTVIHDTEPMSIRDIMRESSNVGTILWAEQLGATAMHDYLENFNLNQPTGLDFAGESSGLLPELDDWNGVTIDTVALGQGIAVTPMQMLGAINVIANDGVYVPPQLVAATRNSNGEETPIDPGDRERVISEETADAVTSMMVDVVRGGTGHRAELDEYEVAGKTGTARIVQEGGGYIDAFGAFRHVMSFTGFVPAHAPEMSAIIVIEEPTTAQFASETAAPVFGAIAQFSLRQLRIPPALDIYVGSESVTVEVVSEASEEDLLRGVVAEAPVPDEEVEGEGPGGEQGEGDQEEAADGSNS